MNKLNEINIKITKAVITQITISLKDSEKGATFDITGELLTEGGKKVSTFYFETDGWQKDRKIELPTYINLPARELFEAITPEVYKRINDSFPMLKGKND